MNTLIAITVLGIICLLFEIFNMRKAIVPFALVGLIASLAITVNEFGMTASYYNNMITTTPFSSAFSALFIVLLIFIVALSPDFYRNEISKISDFIAIKIFLLAGGIAMVSFGNLAMFFLGIEVLSISLYILAASNRLNIKSNEAGMKYFLMGSFASGILLFGICLIYGGIGSFDVEEISALSRSAELPIWFPIGIVLMSIGMFFKIAAAPFHFWAPDVYEGSPTLTAATMSTLTKVVAMASFFKILFALNADINYSFQMMIVAISMLSMTVGNIMALRQINVKRMLAFSGISHAGFMLMTLLSLSSAAGILLYYTAAYALAGIAAFAVLLFVTRNTSNETIPHFNGLGKTRPFLAVIMSAALLSMAGIPIFAGFFAKFTLFTTTINAGYLVLVIVAVINSIISIGYYFKIILAMFTQEPSEAAMQPKVPVAFYLVASLAILANIFIGIFPGLILDLI